MKIRLEKILKDGWQHKLTYGYDAVYGKSERRIIYDQKNQCIVLRYKNDKN